MSLKLYLWGIRLATLLLLGGWIAVTIYIDPEKSGIAGQALFYLSLFLALSGIFALFLSFARKKPDESEKISKWIRVNLRQGILLGLLAMILLIFQQFKMLTWWDGLLAAAGVFLIELYFLSK